MSWTVAVTLLVVVDAFRSTVSVVKVFVAFFAYVSTDKSVIRAAIVALLIGSDALSSTGSVVLHVACGVLFAHISTLEAALRTGVFTLLPAVDALSHAGLVVFLVVRRVRMTPVFTTCQVPVGWTLPVALSLLGDAFFPTCPVPHEIVGSVVMAGFATLKPALMAGVVTL